MNTTGYSRPQGSRNSDRLITEMNNTHLSGTGFQTPPQPSLKGQLATLDQLAAICSRELEDHRKEIGDLQKNKNVLEQELVKKLNDTFQSVSNEVNRLDDELNRHIEHIQSENTRLDGQINTMIEGHGSLNQTLLAIKQRLITIETELGNTEQN